MAAATEKNSDTSSREIRATRHFDAPREVVFRMWTDPQHIAQWWGPRGFTNTIHEMEVRPGGVWRFVMHGPDGTDYQNKIVYQEVVAPERLVYDHVTGPVFHVTVDFIDEGEKTRMEYRMVFESAEVLERVIREFGAQEGLHQTLDRLGERLARGDEREDFVIARTFDAPRELMFRVWTECRHLEKWWGPSGFTMISCKVDLRPGGMFHYGMRSPGGDVMWGKFEYRDVVPPQRLVFLSGFSDEQANMTRHPMAASWPLLIHNTVTFEEHDGRTTVTLRGSPFSATAEERKTFQDGFASMEGGFGGTFRQLEEYLRTVEH